MLYYIPDVFTSVICSIVSLLYEITFKAAQYRMLPFVIIFWNMYIFIIINNNIMKKCQQTI